jgi:hypothetical protein
MATITSMSYLFRSVGGVIGISLTSAIFQGIVKHILIEKITGPNADLVSNRQKYKKYGFDHSCCPVK